MNNLGDYLDKRLKDLDMSRADDLAQIQKLLDEWYPGKCRAQKLQDGKLTISTTSSSVANELRFKQNEIISFCPTVEKVIIR